MIKMKFFVVAIVAIIYSTNCFAQKDTSNNKSNDEVVVFEEVQQPAEFPGGIEGWSKYLQSKLNARLGTKYIPFTKGQKIAKATVVVDFIIDKEGNVSDVHAEKTIPNDVHPAVIKEAIRVIEKGPKWIPAKQNGKLVKYRHRQNITWQVSEE